MTKKTNYFICIALVLCMFASCAKETAAQRGTVSDGYYENKGFGVSFTMPDGWRFLEDSEMAVALGLASDETSDEEIEGLLETSAVIYDMYCVSGDSGTTVNACYELNVSDGEEIYDVDSYLELSQDSLESLMASYDTMELMYTEVTEKDIGGEKVKALDVQIYIIETKKVYYETILVKESGDWMTVITIGSGAETEEDAVKAIDDVISNIKL